MWICIAPAIWRDCEIQVQKQCLIAPAPAFQIWVNRFVKKLDHLSVVRPTSRASQRLVRTDVRERPRVAWEDLPRRKGLIRKHHAQRAESGKVSRRLEWLDLREKKIIYRHIYIYTCVQSPERLSMTFHLSKCLRPTRISPNLSGVPSSLTYLAILLIHRTVWQAVVFPSFDSTEPASVL